MNPSLDPTEGLSGGANPRGGVPIPDAAMALLEGVVNRYIALDPEGAARLARLHGRIILIEILGLRSRIYVIPGADGVQLFGDYAGDPDCTLTGTPLSLARMGVTRRKEESLFAGEVRVAGDTHLAQAFGDLLSGLEVDWEEQLSRLVGDALAHQVGNRVRSFLNWGRQAGNTLSADLGEYLQEEARLLPGRFEVMAFLSDVDHLRDDVERVAARVERLSRMLD